MDRPGSVEFVAVVVRTSLEENIRYPAAALAYYGFVSFVPLLVLVFAAAGGRLSAEFSRAVPQFVTPAVRELVERSVTTAAGRTGAGVFAVLVLGWSSASLVGDLLTVIERVEGDSEATLGTQIRDGLVILGSLGTAILAVVGISILFAALPTSPFVELAGFAGLWFALVVSFVPLYYVPSGAVTSPTAALPGAVTAAFGWAALHTFFRYYATNAGQYAIYGVLSGVIIILTGLYLAASILLIGVIVNAQASGGTDGASE